MNIKQLGVNAPADRSVFVVQEKKSGGGGMLAVLSNRQVLLAWINSLDGFVYLEKPGSKATPVSYDKIARAFQQHAVVNISVMPKEIQRSLARYEIAKAPLLRRV